LDSDAPGLAPTFRNRIEGEMPSHRAKAAHIANNLRNPSFFVGFMAASGPV
jgi:hypothetical protein